MTDEELLADLTALFLPAACSSMHVYCVRVLRLAEEVARGAARTEGRRPAFIAPLDLQTTVPAVLQLDPGPVPAQAPEPAARVQTLAPERFALQCTISGETRAKLERLQALMRHRNPSGDLAAVIDRACDALIAVLEREKFAATSRPRAKGARPESEDPTYIPADVKRAVHERDGEQCTFTSETGVRCTERGYLEFDHIDPVAHRGQPTVDNVRLLCKAHNQYEAERKLGADFMDAQRKRARARASTGREAIAVSYSEAASQPVATPCDPEVIDALTGLGYRSAEARRAVANTFDTAGATLADRLRAALAWLSRSRPIRCSDGPFDPSVGLPTWIALRSRPPLFTSVLG